MRALSVRVTLWVTLLAGSLALVAGLVALRGDGQDRSPALAGRGGRQASGARPTGIPDATPGNARSETLPLPGGGPDRLGDRPAVVRTHNETPEEFLKRWRADQEAEDRANYDLPQPIGTQRARYPRQVRTHPPPGLDAGAFVSATIAELQPLYGRGCDRPDEKARYVELLDLLAETAAGSDDVRRHLMDLAGTPGAAGRDLAILTLGRMENQDALECLLVQCLTSPDASIRETTVRALSQDQGWNYQLQLVPDGGPVHESFSGPIASPRIEEALLAALRRETDPAVLREIVGSLSEGVRDGPLAGPQAEADSAAHPGGMQWAGRITAAFRDLMHQNHDPDLRVYLLTNLWRGESDGAIFLLRETICDPRAPALERTTALKAMASAASMTPEVVPTLLSVVGDADAVVRREAVAALGVARRDDETLDVLLRKSREDPDRTVRREAFHAALYNLCSGKTRAGAVTVPDYDRALALVESAVEAGQEDGAALERDLLPLGHLRGAWPGTPAQMERLKALRGRLPRAPEGH